MTKPHIWPVRIYFEDTDAGGIVYHANYLRFAERARTEMLRAHGIDHAKMVKEEQTMFVVRSCTIDFNKPAKLDDALEVHSSVKDIGNASLTLQQDVVRDGAVLAASTVVLVTINSGGGACRIPAAIRAKIEALQSS